MPLEQIVAFTVAVVVTAIVVGQVLDWLNNNGLNPGGGGGGNGARNGVGNGGRNGGWNGGGNGGFLGQLNDRVNGRGWRQQQQRHLAVPDDEPPLRPDNVPRDLVAENGLRCGICLDRLGGERIQAIGVQTTFCGHMFCRDCLFDWVDGYGTCPTCHRPTTREQVHPIYFDF